MDAQHQPRWAINPQSAEADTLCRYVLIHEFGYPAKDFAWVYGLEPRPVFRDRPKEPGYIYQVFRQHERARRYGLPITAAEYLATGLVEAVTAILEAGLERAVLEGGAVYAI